jgi:sugar lactone lactonase YvrE
VNSGGVISTVAGNTTNFYGGDNGPATAAILNNPWGIAADDQGNLFIADTHNGRIRKVNSSGTITTIAGNGSSGSQGDNGPATAASLGEPEGMWLDDQGNLFFADSRSHKLRTIGPDGTITTVAGNGTAGYGGDGGPATSAMLNYPSAVWGDGQGNLFIADAVNDRVRKVDSSGTITTVAGTGTGGYGGDNGPATDARLDAPIVVLGDGTGNLFISDYVNHRIRKVSSSGTITTVAGTGTAGYGGDSGPATAAMLNHPIGLAIDDGGHLLIADSGNYLIRKVDPTGTITTVAGDGGLGSVGDGGPATDARMFDPKQLTMDARGDLFIADSGNCLIRKITP